MDSTSTIDQVQQPRPEPQFIPKLKNCGQIRILMQNGNKYHGEILKYNRYELLFKENTYPTTPILIMKGGIEALIPMEGNPFETKQE